MSPKFGNSSISMREFIRTSILQGFDQKNHFFQGWTWFKFNNLGLALGMTLKFYTSVAKRLKLKVEKFWGLSLTFVAVTGEKLVGGLFASPPSTHTPTPNTPPPPHPSPPIILNGTKTF